MTSAHQIRILLIVDNRPLGNVAQKILQEKDIKIVLKTTNQISQEKDNFHYIITIVNADQNISSFISQLNQLYQLAQKSNAKLAIILQNHTVFSQDHINLLRQQLKNLGQNKPLHRLIVTKDIYQEGSNQSLSHFEEFIQKVIKDQTITISAKGNNGLHPTNLKDLLDLTLKCLFLSRTAGEEFVVIGEEIKDLELSYMIKNLLEENDQTLNIEAVMPTREPQSEWIQQFSATQAKLNWSPKADYDKNLKNRLKELQNIDSQTQPTTTQARPSFDGSSPATSSPPVSPPSPKEKLTTKPSLITNLKAFKLKKPSLLPQKNKIKTSVEKSDLPQKKASFIIRFLKTILIAAVIIYLLPLFVYSAVFYQNIKYTKSSLENLKTGKIAISANKLKQAEKYQSFNETLTPYILTGISSLRPQFSEKINNLLSLVSHTQSTITSVQQSYLLGEQLFRHLFTDQDIKNPIQISQALKTQLTYIYQDLSQLEILYKYHLLPFNFNQKISSSELPQQLELLKNQTNQSLEIIKIFPLILNSDKPQTIAIIVQDNNELRSTGGAISTLVLAQLENQKIISLKTYPATDIDIQMEGQVTPPNLISHLTGQDFWSFLDTNYHPDFTQSVQDINWFLDRFFQTQPDIVIAVNFNLLKDITTELKTISLNSQVLTTTQIEQQLINSPNNQSSLDYLTQLTDHLSQMIKSNQIPLLSLARPLLSSYSSADLFLWFKNSNIQSIILHQPVSGIVTQGDCHPVLPQEVCLTDTTYFNESNFTISPLNYYQDRTVNHKIKLTQEGIEHRFQINYHYPVPPPSLNRDYQAIYQLILPFNTEFISASINGEKQDISPLAEEHHNLKRFELALSHTPGADTGVELVFLRPFPSDIDITKQFAYSIRLYRQPGTKPDYYHLNVTIPQDQRIAGVTAPAEIQPSELKYSPSPFITHTFGIQFTPSK